MLDVLSILNIVAIVMIATIIPFALWIAYFGYRSAAAKPHDYPEAEAHRIAILICARNEEDVIRRSIESFTAQAYPQEEFDIFVVAHNCTDGTAEIAADAGAHVIVYDAPERRRKADAIGAGIDYINGVGGGRDDGVSRNLAAGRDGGDVRGFGGGRTCAYDYLVIFDADGVADTNFLAEMNKALSAGADIAQEHIIPRNFDTNLVSKLAGILYMQLIAGNAVGVDSAGLPVTLYGCGFAIRMEIVADGWHTRTLVEDFECMVQATLGGRKIVLADKAKGYVEMPVDAKIALRQRRRWTIGDAQCTRLYLREYMRKLRRLGMPGVKVTVELLMIPLMILLGYGLLLELAVIAIKGIGTVAIITIIAAVVVIYLTLSATACLALRKYGHAIRGNVAAVLLSPLWASSMVIFAMQAPFVRDIEWKEIPREGD